MGEDWGDVLGALTVPLAIPRESRELRRYGRRPRRLHLHLDRPHRGALLRHHCGTSDVMIRHVWEKERMVDLAREQGGSAYGCSSMKTVAL